MTEERPPTDPKQQEEHEFRSATAPMSFTPAILAGVTRPILDDTATAWCSCAQERLWFIYKFDPGSRAYNINKLYRLSGKLNVPALEQALNEIVRRHEILRTTFSMRDGQPLQQIGPFRPNPLPVIDLETLPTQERANRAWQLAVGKAHQLLDLEHGPLFSACLFRLGAEEHRLMLRIHHIISDGWSYGIMLEELGTLYAAACAGKPSPLPELPIQYADFAAQQRQTLQGGVLDEHLAYWKKQFAGLPVLDLPTDRPRPATQTFNGAHFKRTLPRQQLAALKKFSQQEGVTLFMTLLAAFNVFLQRYSGQTDIVVGTPIANRTRVEVEELLGCFVNTLVLRSDLSGNPTFRQLLKRVKKICIEAYTHQDLPFEKLVEELNPVRDLSRNPLFQVMLSLENTPDRVIDLPGLEFEPLDFENNAAHMDLECLMRQVPEGLDVRWIFNSDLYDAATVHRMADMVETILDEVCSQADSPISTLRLIKPAEERQILEEWNNTCREYPRDRCIHELFEEQARQTPQAVALVFEGKQLTYQQLNDRADRLASILRQGGVGPEVPVALCVERSLEMIVGMLGILKAGGAYVPLDPADPSARLAFMLADTNSPILLTQVHLRPSLLRAVTSASILCLDDEEALQKAAGGQETVPARSVAAMSPDNLAYIIYTSGSTGSPKGVCIPHRGVVRLVKNNPFARLDPSQVLLQFTAFTFDVSVFEIWGALLNGARLVIFPPGLPSLADLGSFIERHGISTLWLTPALFNPMIANHIPGLEGLQQLLVGGEALSPVHVRQALQQLPGVQLINGYGPTENSVFSCCYAIPPAGWPEGCSTVPIGKPIANSQAYILDPALNLLPVGVVGELYLGGDGLGRGYLNQPELTVEKFIANPFSSQPGARLYKSGDLARCRSGPGGTIEFLGRLDYQVKLRGFRIELGEIEAVLNRHPAVQEAVVIARQDSPGDKTLVAYLLPAPPLAEPLPVALRSFLKQFLPEYMLPSAFVFLDAFPLTASGKVDRGLLPVPEAGLHQDVEFAPRPPGDDIERRLVEIWQEQLQVTRVGVEDNFFDLGGHSLKAMQVISRLGKVFGVVLPLRSIFETPTIAGLAQQIAAARASQAGGMGLKITSIPRRAGRMRRSDSGDLIPGEKP